MCDESVLLRLQPEPEPEPEFEPLDIYEDDYPEDDDIQDVQSSDFDLPDEDDFMDEYQPGDEVLDGDRQISGVTLNGAPVFETDF